SEETRKKMSEARKGKTLSEETRKKLSEAKLGKRSPMSGIFLSEETLKKMSAAQKGVKSSEDIQRKKQAAHQLHLMRRFQQKLAEAIYGKKTGGNVRSSRITPDVVVNLS
ncbi:MAG: NUMOD3 domain-containing DNA-binding protein, partial [Methanoregula sp.]